MTINYSLDENDYLMHQLYASSKSDRTKNKRRQSIIIIPIIYGAFGLFSLIKDKNYGLSIFFFVIAILWYLFYPIFQRSYYKKHFKGFVKENYKNNFGKVVSVEFNTDIIRTTENGSESKILTTEIDEINEIPSLIILKLKSGLSLVLPKDKIKTKDDLTANLKELAAYLNINYHLDLDWQWK
jgi:hypothetical protein